MADWTMNLRAHSRNSQQQEHLLLDHLAATAELAANFAEAFDLPNICRLAGLWHDAGKCQPEFQQYLRECESASGSAPVAKVPHAHVGALALFPQLQLLAPVIAGHHSGLDSLSGLKNSLAQWRTSPKVACAVEAATTLLRGEGPDPLELAKEMERLVQLSQLDLELLLRLLFATLVDADWLDTESHFHPERGQQRGSQHDLAAMQAAYDAYMLRKEEGVPSCEVNRIRAEVRAQCLQAASGSPGVFRLTVPTGGGKTLAALGFALEHARWHGLRRIIFAIPYTSIIEQTAGVYREVFKALGFDAVLEHHSALGEGRSVSGTHTVLPDNEYEERQRLACENWDAPLVVTTTVQLFDSLFANRPAPCRKLHNLARSVIIIDEVQALPVGMLAPCISVLQGLVRHTGASIVLCTATQPALDKQTKWLEGFDTKVQRGEIVPRPARYFKQLQRVDFDWPAEAWDWARVTREMLDAKQCLVIVNTKRDALALLQELLKQGDAEQLGLMHLSALMCAAHRADVLAEVKWRLNSASAEPCRLVSTQVVEAGVDLDFPLMLRALGPLDRIVQAAGRCNREGMLRDDAGQLRRGRVVIFRPAQGSLPPGEYKTATGQTRILLKQGAQLNDPETHTQYFSRLYMGVSTDIQKLQTDRAAFDYPEVARKGHLITNDSETVVVLYPQAKVRASLKEIGRHLEHGNGLTRADFRRLQRHTVSLRTSELKRWEGLLLRDELPGLVIWNGEYDPLVGIGGGSYDLQQLTD